MTLAILLQRYLWSGRVAASKHTVVDVLKAKQIDKCKDLSRVDKAKLLLDDWVKADRHRLATFAVCFWHAVISTYQMWSKLETPLNQQQGHR